MNATGRGAANEPDKHRDNSHQHRFSEIGLFYAFLFNQYVQTCRTFKSRAASDVEESADAPDSKSGAGNSVGVRVPPPAFHLKHLLQVLYASVKPPTLKP